MSDVTSNLVDTLPIGIMIVGGDMRVREWNFWLEQKTGIAAEQARGRALVELFASFHSQRLFSAIEMCLRYKAPQVISQTLNNYVIPIPVAFKTHDLTQMQQQVNVSPLMADGETLAVISIRDVTESVAKSSVLAKLAKKLDIQSNQDQLTGAYNRHFLWPWLSQQLKQCVRHGQMLSCLMLDVDYFKRINDTYGHDVGDAVLNGFAETVRLQLRDSDILVRYGGEEFVALLTHADASIALQIAERILDKVRQTAIGGLDPGAVRCSIGVAGWTPEFPCSAEELIKEADRCLYQAKRDGRDQVARCKKDA